MNNERKNFTISAGDISVTITPRYFFVRRQGWALHVTVPHLAMESGPHKNTIAIHLSEEGGRRGKRRYFIDAAKHRLFATRDAAWSGALRHGVRDAWKLGDRLERFARTSVPPLRSAAALEGLSNFQAAPVEYFIGLYEILLSQAQQGRYQLDDPSLCAYEAEWSMFEMQSVDEVVAYVRRYHDATQAWLSKNSACGDGRTPVLIFAERRAGPDRDIDVERVHITAAVNDEGDRYQVWSEDAIDRLTQRLAYAALGSQGMRIARLVLGMLGIHPTRHTTRS